MEQTYIFAPRQNKNVLAHVAKLVNVAVSEAVENCLLRVRVSPWALAENKKG